MVALYFFGVVLARLVVVFGIGVAVHFLSRLMQRWHPLSPRTAKGRRLDLSFKELVVVALGGMMRGSIAFALILKNVPPAAYRTASDTLLVSTGLGLVIANTLVFSLLTPLCCRALGFALDKDPDAEPERKLEPAG